MIIQHKKINLILNMPVLGVMKYYINGNIKQDIIDGDIVLYNEDTEVIVTLNETASDIWNEVDGKTFEEIKKSFLSHYKKLSTAEYELAQSDLKDVLEKLIDTGCIICTKE